jgi:signal transduction histidine kinase
VFAEVEQGRKLTAVGRLAAGVAHEVNNPLATISIYTQMVLMRNDIPDEVSEKMKIVMEEIKRIQAHMRNLLDLSRLHAPNKTEIRPDLIVKEIADLISFETAARGIDFTIQVCDEPQTIFADGAGIKQVVWNLLRNALDAQEKGGTISVKTYFDHSGDVASTFVIEVADGGPGIPEATLPLVFEPFFTTKEIGKGTGLGLSTVYSIVINHGGTIEVTNLSPHGSLFRVVFPIKR